MLVVKRQLIPNVESMKRAGQQFPTLKMEAAVFFLNLVQIYERARRHVPEGRNFNTEESRQTANETT
jgi:hypothetical protein